jgi:hypothetical protein
MDGPDILGPDILGPDKPLPQPVTISTANIKTSFSFPLIWIHSFTVFFKISSEIKRFSVKS